MGGEKIGLAADVAIHIGSPPRGRGKAKQEEIEEAIKGITPAWAGKSTLNKLSFTVPEDHPRVGGEKTRYAMKVPPW